MFYFMLVLGAGFVLGPIRILRMLATAAVFAEAYLSLKKTILT